MPRKPKTELLAARVPVELADRVREFADNELMTHSEAVRELVWRGLHFGHKVLSDAETERLFDKVFRDAMKP
jgi:hypothetical protein